ncbi:sensor histidine kinase [Alkalicoccus urumqiensis]|uniref:histidine kinase n=1 Tax=Alkalicoccus urumqiensis TaxID=1548213 RepID=A0A2P6MJN9_ALKUR|nr:HAMP domain-containing sensor histidine kinase [Alkalicoccus urumqiensis]PRO66485.1 hypothetical protein C6I21_03855 [Alkalicoccus urumqiensis]
MFNTVQKRYFAFGLLLAGGSLLLLSLLVFWSVERHFGDYVTDQQEQRVEEIVRVIEAAYEAEGSFEEISPMLPHTLWMEEGISAVLYDGNGVQVESGMGGMGNMGGMMQDMMGSGSSGEQRTYPLYAGSEEVGTLEVTYPAGPGSAERQFLRDMVFQLTGLGVLLLAAAALLSHLASRRMTGGLREISADVQALKQKNGQLEKKDYGVKELDELAEGVSVLSAYLEEEDIRRRQFTADLAHELRTPLGALRSQIEAFQDGVMQPDEERLARSHAELMRLVRLVGEMEELYASEQGSRSLRIECIDLTHFATSLETDVQAMFREKGVTLQVDCRAEEVEADPDRLRQVMQNLLHNAWKFTPAGRTVQLRIAEQEDLVELIVEDEGIGMTKDEQRFVFDRFYRGEKSRSRELGGRGIGLSIAAALVHAHGGTIDVSDAEGSGTRFRVRLPKRHG